MIPSCEDPAAPFDAPGAGPTHRANAVLLLHGLTGTPFEVRPVAEALNQLGYRVRTPRVAGHRSPEQLQHTRWEDWLATSRRHFDELAEQHDKVFVVGLSMGALCALVLAHERGSRVGGVVAMAAPLELAWKSQLTLTVARRLPLADAIPFIRKGDGPDVSDASVAAGMPTLDRIPMAAAASLLRGQEAARDRAGRLSVPVLVQHGRFDHVAPVHNAHELMGLLRTPKRRLRVYPRSWHILPLDVEADAVVRDAVDFILESDGEKA